MIHELVSQSGHKIHYSLLPELGVVITVYFYGIDRTVVVMQAEVSAMLIDLETGGHHLIKDGRTHMEVKRYEDTSVMFRILPESRQSSIEEDPETLIFTVEELKNALTAI